MSERAHAFEHGGGARGARHVVERLLLDQQLIEPDHASRHDGFGAFIPHQLIGTPQLRREVFQQVRLGERRREANLRLALPVVEIDRHDEFLARDRLRAGEQRAAPVAELVARFGARRGGAPIRSG